MAQRFETVRPKDEGVLQMKIDVITDTVFPHTRLWITGDHVATMGARDLLSMIDMLLDAHTKLLDATVELDDEIEQALGG